MPLPEVRNKAAHDEVINRDEAGQARAGRWVFWGWCSTPPPLLHKRSDVSGRGVQKPVASVG